MDKAKRDRVKQRIPKKVNTQREKALKLYYENPSFCGFCKIMIEPKDYEPVCYMKNKKFCSLQCNSHHRWSLEKGGEYTPRRPNVKPQFERTLEEVDDKNRVIIGRRARRNYELNMKEIKCEICGYNGPVDVAHIKAIASFSKDTKLKEVNHIDNLVGLCPNHHREFDRGDISLETIKALVSSRLPRP